MNELKLGYYLKIKMEIQLPEHPFFEFIEAHPTLIYGKELYTATTNQVASDIGNLLVFANRRFKLEKISDTLQTYDKKYMAERKNKGILETAIEEEYKKQNGSNEKILGEITTTNQLSFLIKLLKAFNPNRETELTMLNQAHIEEIFSSLSILGETFLNNADIYFSLNKRIYTLQTNQTAKQSHILFHGRKYSPYSYKFLDDAKKEFKKICRTELEKIIRKHSAQYEAIIKQNKDLLSKYKDEYFERRQPREKYESPEKYGFKKIGKIYYAILECRPHAYLDDRKYYIFEKADVALRIPFKENGEVDYIRMINESGEEITKNVPCILNTEYRHPAIRAGVGVICYRGENYRRQIELIEKDFECSIESEKGRLSEDEVKAKKMVHLLRRAGLNVMVDGLTKAVLPNTKLTDLPENERNEHDYKTWREKKINEGWPKFNAKEVK